MTIAEQLRQKSKLVKSQKAKRTLEKTLFEKRKKAKATAEKMAKEKAILKKQREKLSAEKLKRSIELENLKFLERSFNRFLLEAWNSNVQINPTEIEIKKIELLSRYGLKILSTEDFVNLLNKNITQINTLIKDFNREYLTFMSQFKKNSKGLSLCSPKKIQDESYDFLIDNKHISVAVDLCKHELSQKIEDLNFSHSRLISDSERSKKDIESLVNNLSSLAELYSDYSLEFQSKYLIELRSPPPEILHEYPDLMKLTYAERLADRRYQFRIAKKVMTCMGLTIPKQDELFNSAPNAFRQYEADSGFDVLGRYLAFFRIMVGGNPYDAVINSVKEDLIINIFPDGAEYRQKIREIEWQIREETNTLKKFIKFDGKDYLSKIYKKISELKTQLDNGKIKIPFNSVNFISEELFDLDDLKSYQSGSAVINQRINEIHWLLSSVGRLNVEKFFKALEKSSATGKFTLTLSYLDIDGVLTFRLNSRRVFQLSISIDSFLKILDSDKLVCTLKTSSASNLLTVKW